MTESPAPTNVRHKWLALAVLAAALSMIVLDGTIVGVALPAIIKDLSLQLTEAQWVNSLYSVIFAALLLTFGKLGDRGGRRLLFLIGVALFVAGSLTAATAHDAVGLIGSRALQGLGGAMVLPATLSTVNATFRGRDRHVAFGIWGAVMAGMAAVGPLLGGWLATYANWRWIFWVNLPLGIAVVVGGLLWVPETRARDDRPGFDVPGLLLSTLGLASVVFGLIEGTNLGWLTPSKSFAVFSSGDGQGLVWPDTMPIALPPVAIVLGLALLIGFTAWEQHRLEAGRSVLLDLTLFGIPTFTWGNVTAMAVNVGEFALVFALPLYLVNVLALDVMGAGLVLAAMALGAFFSGASARHLAERLGPPRVVILGLALEVVGVAATALVVGPETAPWFVALTMAVYGLGLGLASAQLTSTVLVGVPTDHSGAASATQSTLRQLGAALGSALAGTVLAAALTVRIPPLLRDAGVPDEITDMIVDKTVGSAGGTIPRYRAMGGEAGDVVPYLVKAFSEATAWVLWTAGAFLVLGLIGSFVVARHAKNLTLADEPEEFAG